jgi:signal transduction histidine kinase
MAKLKVRARAVDMLGRQQVAGIPTAISELFKNAHDAYARRVEVDFYRRRSLFVLRDDGVGMSREDFEQRWLTLGTESKANGGGLGPPPIDPDQPLRPVMGEKGIGRLAIALIGPQVLIITRPKVADTAKTTVAFVNWSVFALPGVDLSDIDIPIIELDAGTLPTASDVRGLVESVAANVQYLAADDPEAAARIHAELAQFDINAADIATRLPEGPDLRSQPGTQFWIMPTNEILEGDIDGAGRDEEATPLEKALLGFTNTMTPGHHEPPILAKFRDHKADGIWVDQIGENNFFTPLEFEASDHHVEGNFDGRGQFKGSIKVYGADPVPYTVRWANPSGVDTLCGPIKINFSYVQGAYKDSRLPREDWVDITAKLNKIGGLYIYRDDVRVLPYGDSDYDFLDIENRRTRSAGYYFFSYRRIFGVVEITRSQNHALVEKAGREGFQENKAYRQFRSILTNFFIQTAADFFRDDGTHADVWLGERTRLNQEQDLLEKRKKQVSVRRRDLQIALEKFFGDINERVIEERVAAVLERVETEYASAHEQGLSLESLMASMREARSTLVEIDRGATVVRPRGVGFTRDLSRLWSRYEVERRRLVDDHIRPAYAKLDDLLSQAAERADLNLDVRRMVAEVLEELGNRERRRARSLQSEVQKSLGELRERALSVARTGLQSVDTTVRSTLVSFEHIGPEDIAGASLQKTRERFEQEILVSAEEQTTLLERLRDQLKAAATPDALARDPDDLLEALEGELEERRERDLESLQLAQMGMAIGIVHHEFHAVIRGVRQNVRRLKNWADKNSALRSLYEDISRSYSHLDGYLSLFAPLNRRLSQSKTVFSGEDIRKYLIQLLGERMERHNVELIATPAFREARVTELVSTLYPPFVNLVDNALYWLEQGSDVSRKGEPPENKVISLDFESGAFIISDTGPGVLPADYDAVFESGFSRKAGGSGLGLYITRSLLERAGYALTLAPYVSTKGATFRIQLPALEDSVLSQAQE